MRRLSHIITLLLIVSSCTKDNLNVAPSFNIVCKQISDGIATATVTHTGTERDLYVLFFLRGEITDAKQALTDYCSNKSCSDLLAISSNHRKHIHNFPSLKPKETYTFIVFGIDAEGYFTGQYASCKFSLQGAPITPVEADWMKMIYKGQYDYLDRAWSCIDIIVDNDSIFKEHFYVCVHPESEVNSFDSLIDFLYFAHEHFVKEKNTDNDPGFWLSSDELYMKSVKHLHFLAPGRYYAFAIAVNKEGLMTGRYATTGVFTMEGYTLDADYAAMLGDWELTDATGKKQIVTFEELWANYSFGLRWYGRIDSPIKVYYTPHSSSIFHIPAQSILGAQPGKEEHIWSLSEWYNNLNGKMIIENQAKTLAYGYFISPGEYIIKPAFTYTLSDKTTKASETGMIMSYITEEKKTVYSNLSKMQFPIKMKRNK